MDSYNIDHIFRKRGEKPLNKWFYIFVLFLSFVWSSVYVIENSLSEYYFMNYGKLFQISSPNFSYEIIMLLSMGIIYVLGFEIVFFLYRYIISFKVYSFIIPMDRLKADTRLTYAFRNFLYGIFMNLCFVYPYLYSYATLASLFFTMTVLIYYVTKIYSTYSEPLISHFVFKTFVYPVFFYEVLSIIFSIGGIF